MYTPFCVPTNALCTPFQCFQTMITWWAVLLTIVVIMNPLRVN